ncbi:transmembrane protein 115 [Arctopsyche grandis]|uniref:transmembrane protein 115 n=1 Tax=Arctopsyche grandis TaxID=121162 RepID=UPI00406D6559
MAVEGPPGAGVGGGGSAVWGCFRALLGNASRPVKAVCVCVMCGWGVSWWEGAAPLLAVTPGLLLPPTCALWTALTFCFLEAHLWAVVADVVTVGLCGKLVEPLWGRKEMLLFFAVTNVGVALVATAYYLLLYTCTRNPDYLFDVRIRGLAGYIAAVSVAVKQVMPDHLLIKTSLGKVTNRIIPLLVFFVALCLWAIGLLEGTYPCMWASGSIVSWVYLRFWQRHNNGTRGDAAENFSFDNFFPNILQPLIRAIWRPFEKCLVRLGICPASRRRVHLALSPGGLTISLPGVEPQDMERRRQIALKALSERLSKTGDQARHKSRSSKGTTQVPSFQNPDVNIQGDASIDTSMAYISGKSSHRDYMGGLSPTGITETTLINIDTPTTPTSSSLNQQMYGNS